MKNKITTEDIRKAFEEVFNTTDKDTKRVLKGVRGCITRGYVDLNDFSHCGNNKCSSCNMVRQALEDEITRINFKLYEK